MSVNHGVVYLVPDKVEVQRINFFQGLRTTMIRNLRTSGLAYIAACAVLAALSTPAASQEESIEKTVLRDQVRSQGHVCNDALSAELIAAESIPGEPVYLLMCENATYQIRLVPHQAAKVTPIN